MSQIAGWHKTFDDEGIHRKKNHTLVSPHCKHTHNWIYLRACFTDSGSSDGIKMGDLSPGDDIRFLAVERSSSKKVVQTKVISQVPTTLYNSLVCHKNPL
jgi:hypothetical protein